LSCNSPVFLHQSYPTGNISKHFAGLKVGDFVDIKGPKGQMKYTNDYANAIGMIAGGTGITPMLVCACSELPSLSLR
jgi:cytochrome-b5 reductase